MRAMLPCLLLACAASTARAQHPKRCAGEVPDSATFLAGPVYRDCETDRAARRRGTDPRLQISLSQTQLREGCYYAELQFIVDTLGVVEQASIKIVRSDMRELLDAVRESLNQLHYEPAMKDGKKVRQVTVYRRSVAIAAPRTGAAFNPPLPRCTNEG